MAQTSLGRAAVTIMIQSHTNPRRVELEMVSVVYSSRFLCGTVTLITSLDV